MARVKVNLQERFMSLLAYDANAMDEPQLKLNFHNKAQPQAMPSPAVSKYSSIVGVDEVGRGCLAGPVVVCAVCLPRIEVGTGIFEDLVELNDSKAVRPEVRERLSSIIQQQAIWCIAEGSIEEIESLNILGASLLAMKRAVDGAIELLNERGGLLAPPVVLVDGNQRIPNVSLKQRTVIKGDATSASIAAASVVAKVYRDGLMTRLGEEFPHYAWESNKGYGSLTHRELITKYGISKWHRQSFLH